jgi:hypothetical protein
MDSGQKHLGIFLNPQAWQGPTPHCGGLAWIILVLVNCDFVGLPPL